ncbi:hypothetical protein HanRHA438_Chr15g0699851 [Helianthus annuus]|nr:hypothetical protein HanIR_Chr15g0747131 [Helianthus annuus]KAJ0844208.1 hypothetical protein HanRHA438_Chr15g0699851 [Helianthus annuus]
MPRPPTPRPPAPSPPLPPTCRYHLPPPPPLNTSAATTYPTASFKHLCRHHLLHGYQQRGLWY